jgi:nicotinamidase-related amidase
MGRIAATAWLDAAQSDQHSLEINPLTDPLNMTQSRRRIVPASSALLVVDMQERLLTAMLGKESLLQNVLRLVQGATILGLPRFVTEQYRKGLGPTISELVTASPDFQAFEKLTFSAWGASGLREALQAGEVRDVIVCGIEAHVCVAQTCLDLLDADLRPFVVADAVSSRTADNRQAGLDRLRDAGATVVSTEMILFELLDRAGTEQFKQVQRLIK